MTLFHRNRFFCQPTVQIVKMSFSCSTKSNVTTDSIRHFVFHLYNERYVVLHVPSQSCSWHTAWFLCALSAKALTACIVHNNYQCTMHLSWITECNPDAQGTTESWFALPRHIALTRSTPRVNHLRQCDNLLCRNYKQNANISDFVLQTLSALTSALALYI